MTPVTDSNRNPELLAAAHWASDYAMHGEHGYELCVVLSYLGQRYEAARRAIDREKTRAVRAEAEIASLRAGIIPPSGHRDKTCAPEGTITIREAASIAGIQCQTLRFRISKTTIMPVSVLRGTYYYSENDLRPLMGPVPKQKQRRHS